MSSLTSAAAGWLRNVYWGLLRTAVFIVLTFVLAYGDPRQLSRTVVGNPGDAYLIYSLLAWGSDKTTSLLSGFSDGPMFASGSNAMAYSDTFIPLLLPYRLIEAVGVSPTVTFNVLYLASWILTCEFTYRLAARCGCSRPTAMVGAVAFAFTTLRLAQTGHFQLAWGAFIPLAFLVLLRVRRHPTIGNGVLLAAVVVAQFLTSAYYGVILLVGIGALLAVDAIVAWRRDSLRPIAPGYASAAIGLVVLMAPVATWYRAAEDDYVHHRAGYPAYFRLRLGDLRSPAPTADLARRIPWFDPDPALGSSESFAYVGLFVVVLVPVFLVLLAMRRSQLFADRRQAWALGSVALVGLLGASIAIGRGPILSVKLPFYDIARILVPGVSSMLAIVRLFVFMQLALVLAAAVALTWCLGRIANRPARAGIAAIVLAIVIIDSSLTLDRSDVPAVTDGSVYAAMRELAPGKAVELPIPPIDEPSRPYLESTRMLLGSEDALQIVNGHSGHWPVGYAETVAALNEFPDERAIDELRRIGVKYVILHSAPVETGMHSVTSGVNNSGYAYFEPDELDRILAAIPEQLLSSTTVADDGVILTLRPGG